MQTPSGGIAAVKLTRNTSTGHCSVRLFGMDMAGAANDWRWRAAPWHVSQPATLRRHSPMSLTLYFHPLASYCHKVLVALYESAIPFQGRIIDLGNAEERAELAALWPVGKFPVLRDEQRGRTVPESSIIIEYLCQHFASAAHLLPHDPGTSLEVRLWDRFFDLYVQGPMQKIVGDHMQPEGEHDLRGVAGARATLGVAYSMLERQLAHGSWVVGNHFTMADCAAMPALFYASILAPFPAAHQQLACYFERLMGRPSVRRTLDEARPYFPLFPFNEAIPARFLREGA
jgi:glutathione S-transferase